MYVYSAIICLILISVKGPSFSSIIKLTHMIYLDDYICIDKGLEADKDLHLYSNLTKYIICHDAYIFRETPKILTFLLTSNIPCLYVHTICISSVMKCLNNVSYQLKILHFVQSES